MARLSSDDTKHVANLAKLQLTKDEITKFSKQLSEVLVHIDELSEIDVKNTDAKPQTDLVNVLREDKIDVTNCLPQDGFFIVEQILKKDD